MASRPPTAAMALRGLLTGGALNLDGLTTTNKTHLVAALNEVKGLAEGKASINDASSSSTSQTYSITKIRDYVTQALDALATGAPTALPNHIASCDY